MLYIQVLVVDSISREGLNLAGRCKGRTAGFEEHDQVWIVLSFALWPSEHGEGFRPETTFCRYVGPASLINNEPPPQPLLGRRSFGSMQRLSPGSLQFPVRQKLL